MSELERFIRTLDEALAMIDDEAVTNLVVPHAPKKQYGAAQPTPKPVQSKNHKVENQAVSQKTIEQLRNEERDRAKTAQFIASFGAEKATEYLQADLSYEQAQQKHASLSKIDAAGLEPGISAFAKSIKLPK